MSKLSAEAFVKLQELVDSGKMVQLEKNSSGYEVTVFENPTIDPCMSHNHFQAESLIEAISEVKD